MTNALSKTAEENPDLFNPTERVFLSVYAIYLEGGRSPYESLWEAASRAHVSDVIWMHCISVLEQSWDGRIPLWWNDKTLGMSRTAAKRFLKRAIAQAAHACPNSRPPSKIFDPGLNSEARV